MPTLVTDIAIRKTELYSRQKIFDNTYGIKLDGGVSTIDIQLDTTYELPQVSNFLMISTDSTIDMVIHQINQVVDANNVVTYKTDTVSIPVSGIFVAYANFGKVILQRNKNITRVPKVSIVYS